MSDMNNQQIIYKVKSSNIAYNMKSNRVPQTLKIDMKPSLMSSIRKTPRNQDKVKNTENIIQENAKNTKINNLLTKKDSIIRPGENINKLREKNYSDICGKLTLNALNKENNKLKMRIKNDFMKSKDYTELMLTTSRWEKIFSNYTIEEKKRENLLFNMHLKKNIKDRQWDERLVLTCKKLRKEIELYETLERTSRKNKIRSNQFIKHYGEL